MRILLLEGGRAGSSVRLCWLDSLEVIDVETIALSVNIKQDTSLLLLLSEKDLQALHAGFLAASRRAAERCERKSSCRNGLRVLEGGMGL